MDKIEFIEIRKKLDKTQKEMASLLGVSPRTVESYEQGLRNVPVNVERIVYYLLFKLNMHRFNGKDLCWLQKDCPVHLRKDCMAWIAREGFFCWFLTGKACKHEQIRSEGATQSCFECPFFNEKLNMIM